jgi:hypothetical protein
MSLAPPLRVTPDLDDGNARFLAVASWLAYLPDPSATDAFAQHLGLAGTPHASGSTQAFVGANDGQIVVAFRGTQDPRTLEGLQDWLINADFQLAAPAGVLGGADFEPVGVDARFHRGFLGALEAVWDPVLEHVLAERTKALRPLWVTGHSLGGALATLAAWRFYRQRIDVQQIYTFAAPMVGNQAAAEGYDSQFGDQLIRYVVPDDPVPWLPRSGWLTNRYVQAGRQVLLAADPAFAQSPTPAFFEEIGRAAQQMTAITQANFLSFFWDQIQARVRAHNLDHSYIPKIETRITPPVQPWADIWASKPFPEAAPVAAAPVPVGASVAAPREAVASAAVLSLAAGLTAAAGAGPATLVAGVAQGVQPTMDPHLQWVLTRQRHGRLKQASVSVDAGEVAVIARVTDRAAWEALTEVRVGAVLGEKEDGTEIVTGRIPVGRIEAVHAQPFVTSLKAAVPLRPSLSATLAETGARADLLPGGYRANGGQGVVVGVIDFGFDVAHRHFRRTDPTGTTRLLTLWNQGGPSGPQSPYGYGRVYSPAEINSALGQRDPYAYLGYGPAEDPSGTHGTHVTDIAAGNGYSAGPGQPSNTPGVAPQADLVFVELSATDLPAAGPAGVTTSLGDSVRLLEALDFVFTEASNRPCVINVSLGTNGGPHDGTTLVEQGIDRLVRGKPNRAVVIAAANSYADGIHAAGTVPAAGTYSLTWQVPDDRLTPSELQVWYSGNAQLSAELLGPDGGSLMTVGPGANQDARLAGRVVLLVANRLHDPNNGDNQIAVFLDAETPAGNYVVRLHNAGQQPVSVHAWIERDDVSPSRFAPPNDNSHTIGSISCGKETIAVGSYDAHWPATPLSYFSSAGPTRDGRKKPEVSAPGHDVWAAQSRSSTGVVRKSGTSMAAPAVTGLVALLLADAAAKGVALSITQIRAALEASARKNPPAGPNWDPRYGFGRATVMVAPVPQAPSAPQPAGPAPPTNAESLGGSTEPPPQAPTPAATEPAAGSPTRRRSTRRRNA